MTTAEQLVVNALLCDAAQAVGDKLYILGGGWSYVWPAQPRAPVMIAKQSTCRSRGRWPTSASTSTRGW
jgi:hypothetical protein